MFNPGSPTHRSTPLLYPPPVYTAANISGGHLNPAVTISTLLCGFYPVLHAVLYIILQIAGGICGSLLAAGLMPGAKVGMGAKGPGCFEPKVDVGVDALTAAQLFGWETIMTFTLISAVYACGIAKPGHGSFTPLVVGLTLTACAGTGGRFTGAALNPARVIGPAAVFKCSKGHWWNYILAEILAAVLACAVFAFVSGWGPLSPLRARKEYGLTNAEAIKMWVTGTPPARLRANDEENMEVRAGWRRGRPGLPAGFLVCLLLCPSHHFPSRAMIKRPLRRPTCVPPSLYAIHPPPASNQQDVAARMDKADGKVAAA